MELLIRVIAAFEQFRPTTYLDAVGRPTCGYGHLIRPGETFDKPLTPEQGLKLLDTDIQEAKDDVDRLFRSVFLADWEYDALVSFAFNVGGAALEGSTLRKRLLSNLRRDAAAEFLRWVYGSKKKPDGTEEKVKLGGLVRRRDCESVWFLGAHPSVIERMSGADVTEHV